MKWVLSILLLLVPSFALAEDLSDVQVQALAKVYGSLKPLENLVANGTLSAEQVQPNIDKLLAVAQQIAGRPITSAEIGVLVQSKLDEGTGIPLVKEDKLARFLTFKNILIFIAGLFLVVGIGGVVAFYLGPYVLGMPYAVWEFLAWTATLTGLASYHLWPWTDFWLVFPGAIAVVPCVALTVKLHFGGERNVKAFAQVLAAICFVLWGWAAIEYQSYFLGFITIMALEGFLGFSVFVRPLCYGFGFEDEDVIPRTMSASLVILLAYVVTFITRESFGQLDVFKPGMLWMGAFVYYLGCLIVSNSYYYSWFGRRKINLHYVLMQVMTIISGIAAFYVGTQFDIKPLLGIGGTFFTFYLVEKYLEIPWRGVGWFWSLLALAAALYFFAGFATAHPEYFIFLH